MKKTKFGLNRTQTFVDFYTPDGLRVRFGAEGKQIFLEIDEQKTYITDVNRNLIAPILTDLLAEKTVGAGITTDGVLLKDGIVGGTTAHIATSDGLTTGQLLGATQFVTVTSAGANNIISLPKAAGIPIGTKIRGMVNATGFELRAHSDDVASVAINNISGANTEAAIPADTSFKVELISATEWILTALTNLGAVLVIVPDAT